ncbi:MAG TPA: hypothetical protein ENJ09_01900 [Planctomycetes bacterium]|nr:hypothetical protein [Planctomycetota bacterium]
MPTRTEEHGDDLFSQSMTSQPATEHLSDVGAGTEGGPPIEERLASLQAEWKREAKALGKLASAVGPLTRAGLFPQLKKVRGTLAKVRKKVEGIEGVEEKARVFLEEAERELERRREALEKRFAPELRAACEAARLELHVVRREGPLELRIPPFAVVIDRAKGSAEIHFARLAILKTAADPESILEAHRKALGLMRKGFEPAAFFDACFSAWNCARADGPAGSSRASGGAERVEIQSFLPHLALQLQPRSFRIEPSAKNFRPYSRSRFAFDLMQLRGAGMLTRNGARLNLGVASGTSASKKNRALFVEDEMGRGEYKLTVYFTRTET